MKQGRKGERTYIKASHAAFSPLKVAPHLLEQSVQSISNLEFEDSTLSIESKGVNLDDLALNSRLAYPIIPAMHSTALRIKKTNQILRCGDARELDWIPDESIHLVVTSPPYWTLKEYPKHKAQLGFISDYEQFHNDARANL